MFTKEMPVSYFFWMGLLWVKTGILGIWACNLNSGEVLLYYRNLNIKNDKFLELPL